MIHHNSTDPVLIKKISLRIWSLRDEVEAVLKRRLEIGESEEVDIKDLIDEYKYKGQLPEANSEESGEGGLKVIEGGASEEDELAALEAEVGGESESEESAEASSEEDSEEENAAQANSDQQQDGEAVIVKQRRPTNIPEDKIYGGTVILSEMEMNHIYFFSGGHFLEGQSIVIEFVVPKRFILNADVVYCRPYNMKSRIISKQKLPYRVAAKFTFLKEGERTLLRQFIQSIEPDVSQAPAKPVAAPGGDEDSDFDDLDDLDL